MNSPFAPTKKYRYDGKFKVVDWYVTQRKHGFNWISWVLLKDCFSSTEIDSDQLELEIGDTPIWWKGNVCPKCLRWNELYNHEQLNCCTCSVGRNRDFGVLGIHDKETDSYISYSKNFFPAQ